MKSPSASLHRLRNPKSDAAAVLCAVFAIATASVGCSPVLSAESGKDAINSGDKKSLTFFNRRIVPILEQRCGISCHGYPSDSYAEHMKSGKNAPSLYFPIDPKTGRIPATAELRYLAWNVVRGRTSSATANNPRIDHQAAPEFSPLLRAPLTERLGGIHHHGMDIFYDDRDPDYQTLHEWVEMEIALRPQSPPKLSVAESFFKDEVVGVLERNSCYLSSCHGPYVFNDLKLTSPLPRRQHKPGDQPLARYSPKMLAKLRQVVLGKVSRFVNIEGDLRRSRLIVKNIPVSKGGVHQRGGNVQFFSGYDDPDVQTLLKWMELERAQVVAKLTSRGKPIAAADIGREQGVAFLRGPRHTPRRFFEFDDFYPGTELMLKKAGKSKTTVLHSAPNTEIQSLDVRYDARAIAFSMRQSENTGFRIWQLELADDLTVMPGSLKQLSHAPAVLADGTIVHHIDPLYMPMRSGKKDLGLDAALDQVAVAYASNEAGAWAQSEAWALLGEADGGDQNTLTDSQRYERAGTFNGRRLHFVAGPMKGDWRTIKRHKSGGHLQLDKPLDGIPDRTWVYTIENTEPAYRSAYDIWRLQPEKGGEQLKASARRMTFTNAQERRPTMRTTGEFMPTTVRNRGYLGDKPIYNGAIYRIQGGGFDYHIQGGNRSRFPLWADSRELASGLEIRLALDPRNLTGGGTLMLIDHGFGVNIEPDNPVDSYPVGPNDRAKVASNQRFLPTQYPVLPETGRWAVTPTGVSKGGSFRDPYPVRDGSILVARATHEIDHLSPNADPNWDIMRLRFRDNILQSEDGQGPGEPVLTPLVGVNTSRFAEFSPRPIIVRLKEKSKTKQKFAARADGQKPTSDDGVLRYPKGELAEIECYDFPLLQAFFENFAPTAAKDLRDDELRYVRIIRQIPPARSDIRQIERDGPDADPFATPVSIGVHDAQEIVSEIPLEADGSFYAKAPTDVPLIVQGLNADKMAVISMARWFYLQPGEKLSLSIPRSIFPTRCAGCHGSLTGDTVDSVGPPDLVSAASLVMATWNGAEAKRRKPYPVIPVTVDFRADVQPIIKRRCVRCHGDGPSARPAAGDLDLRAHADGPWTVAYSSLHRLEHPPSGNHARKKYVNEREALSSESFLMEKLTGREYNADRTLANPGVVHVPELTPDELLTLIRWIDLGATFKGSKNDPPPKPLAVDGAAPEKMEKTL